MSQTQRLFSRKNLPPAVQSHVSRVYGGSIERALADDSDSIMSSIWRANAEMVGSHIADKHGSVTMRVPKLDVWFVVDRHGDYARWRQFGLSGFTATEMFNDTASAVEDIVAKGARYLAVPTLLSAVSRGERWKGSPIEVAA